MEASTKTRITGKVWWNRLLVGIEALVLDHWLKKGENEEKSARCHFLSGIGTYCCLEGRRSRVGRFRMSVSDPASKESSQSNYETNEGSPGRFLLCRWQMIRYDEREWGPRDGTNGAHSMIADKPNQVLSPEQKSAPAQTKQTSTINTNIPRRKSNMSRPDQLWSKMKIWRQH